MKKFWKKKAPTAKPDAPDDGELLAYLDSELTAARQAEIRQLLAGDWRLRVRLAELERDIEIYVKATYPQRQGEPPPFEEVWRGVAQRLTEPLEPLPVEAELRSDKRDQPGLSARFSPWAAALMQQPVLLRWSVAALLAAAVIGLSFWWLSSEQLHAVSAEELLQRATQAEAAPSKQIAEPVVYRRIQVRRAGMKAVTWESWRAAGKNQFRQRVAAEQGGRQPHTQEPPPLIAEITAIFQANKLDVQRPLSAAAFAAWRKTLQPKAETIREVTLSGAAVNDGLQLITTTPAPYAVNALMEASLTVRKSDWHSVAQHLKVRGANEIREYELSEMGYEVLPLHALPVFAELGPAPLPAPVPTASPAPLPSLTPPVAPTEAALQEAEVAALFALHQAQADLGEQIEIVREPRQRIIVRGLVETEERKRQLQEALHGLPLVNCAIQTVAEAEQQRAKEPARALDKVDVAAPVISATPSVNAFQQRLERHFAERSQEGRQKVTQLAQEVFAEAAAALAEAWAVRRLAERFQQDQEADLPPAARQRMEQMRNHQLTRLQARSRKLHAQLVPLLSAIAGEKTSVAPTPAAATWTAQALQLQQAVAQVHQLVSSLFGGAGATAETPEHSARRLREALARLDGALLGFERITTK